MTKPIPEKNYYRPDELARAMDVSAATVRRWVRKGLIRHVRWWRLTRIPRAEFERILRDGISGRPRGEPRG
jgi:excisionase family DNA binding protein